MKRKILLLTTYLLLSNSILINPGFAATSEVKENIVVNEKKPSADLIDEIFAFINENFSGSEAKKEVSSSVKNKLGLELLEAINKSKNDKAKELIAQGCDINMPDDSGYTALMQAALKGNKEIVKILIDKGANVNVKTPKGESLITFIHKYGTGDQEILSLLEKEGAK